MLALEAPCPSTYLSITARHSFLHVNRLPRRSLKVPEVAVTGGGVCLHSGSSIGMGAGLMLSVAPKDNKHCVSQRVKSQAHPLTPAREKKKKEDKTGDETVQTGKNKKVVLSKPP